MAPLRQLHRRYHLFTTVAFYTALLVHYMPSSVVGFGMS
jgi:hypothetical protein